MTEKITSSNYEPRKRIKREPSGKKPILVVIDNLRFVARSIPKEHELYSPDTFLILKHYMVGERTKAAEEAYLLTLDASIIELKFGSYKVENI